MKEKRLWRNVVEVPADGKKGWHYGAYTFAFVYSKKGNFLIKGYRREVQSYIKENFQSHYFVNFTLYDREVYRNIWHFWKEDVHIHEANPFFCSRRARPEHRKWKFYRYDDDVFVEFKRLPKRWVPELEIF